MKRALIGIGILFGAFVAASIITATPLVGEVVTLHTGFYDAADIIFDDVVEAIEPLLDDGRRLWIRGIRW